MKVNTQQRAKLIETDDKPDAIAINVDAGNVFFSLLLPAPPPFALHFVINILFEVICCCCACY